jgi:hypothetical protein
MLRASREHVNSSTSPMMSGSGVAIGSQDSAPEFKDVLNKSLSLLLDEAATIQRNILTSLEREYSKELTPGHTPSWYDVHKERHVKKVATAKLLKALCKKELKTLADVEQFISYFRQVQATNALLDKKGGKLGKVLDENSVAVGTLDGNVFTIRQDMDRINDCIHTIITQLIADAMETEATLQFKYNRGRVRVNTTHVAEIMRYTDMLVNLYLSKAYMANVDQRQKETIAKQKVNAYIQQIRDALDQVETCAVSRVVKTSQKTDDRSLDVAIVSDKVAYLGSLLRSNLIEKIIQGLPLLRNGLEPLSQKDRTKALVFDLMMKEFVAIAKINEKALLWEYVVREDNDIEGNLCPDQKRLREDFYINCYRDAIIDSSQPKKRMTADQLEDVELSKIIAEETGARKSFSKKSMSSYTPIKCQNFKDFFSTNQFLMDLSSIANWLFTAGTPVDLEQIIQRAQSSLRSHMENHLDKLKESHTQSFLRMWNRKLTDMVDDFLAKLVMANNLIEQLHHRDGAIVPNHHTAEILQVITRFAPLANTAPFISEEEIERVHLGVSVARQGLFSANLPNPAGHGPVRIGLSSNLLVPEVWPSNDINQNNELSLPSAGIQQTK